MHGVDDKEKKRCAEIVCFGHYPHSPCPMCIFASTVIQAVRPVSIFSLSLSITVPCVCIFVIPLNPKNLREAAGKAKFSAEF